MCPSDRYCPDLEADEHNCRNCIHFSIVYRAIDQLAQIDGTDVSLRDEIHHLRSVQNDPSVVGVCMRDYIQPMVIHERYEIIDCPKFERKETIEIRLRKEPYPKEMINSSDNVIGG